MNHEPECIWPTAAMDATECSMCVMLRTAYQRGRIDERAEKEKWEKEVLDKAEKKIRKFSRERWKTTPLFIRLLIKAMKEKDVSK